MIPQVHLCSQVVLSNWLNKFDVELSFLNDLRFSLISNLFLDLDSLFRNLFKLQLSMLSIYIFEFVAYIYMHILHFIRKLWFHVAYQLFIHNCIFKKKKKNEKKSVWMKDPYIFSKVFCSFNITNVMLLIMALQYVVCVGWNSRMLIQ